MRIIIKVGSSSLTDKCGALDKAKLKAIATEVAHCKLSGHEVVLVSSGAVAAGLPALGLTPPLKSIALRQAAAAVGQGLLIHHYSQEFRHHGLTVAQVLLGRRDFAVRESYNNALRAFNALLDNSVIPIVNENDVVVLKENSFGDNDRLGALVSALLHADLFIICTDVPYIYSADPRIVKDAYPLHQLDTISDELIENSGGAGSTRGTGGMVSKLRAARIALTFGVPTYIGATESLNLWSQIVKGSGKGTYIGRTVATRQHRKLQWIAFHSESCGKIYIDCGAVTALTEQGRSLLPAGVTNIHGSFERGDVVEVYGPGELLIGKGISEYTAEQLHGSKGQSTTFAIKESGACKPEVIHRDNWIPLNESFR
jgi:glutamate 5-kinase